ncbi:MAG: hypothetical protein M3P04_09010, partial [Actinomycetota bacterium]|nr:hypothetical protein [Actinomycetota bacterium]
VSSPEEIHLLVRLLDHVQARGGRYSWGTGGTPGVTGWYPVDAKDTPVWNINIGAGPGKGRLYFIFGEYATRHLASGRVVSYADAVSSVVPFAEKITEIKSNDWKGWASVPLALGAAYADAVLTAAQAAIS